MTEQTERERVVEVSTAEWLKMHRDLGMAEGLLTGWLHVRGDDAITAREATRRFLARGDHLKGTTDAD